MLSTFFCTEHLEGLMDALAYWQQREMAFPARVRRMQPDDFDMQSGAWARCVEEAQGRDHPTS